MTAHVLAVVADILAGLTLAAAIIWAGAVATGWKRVIWG